MMHEPSLTTPIYTKFYKNVSGTTKRKISNNLENIITGDEYDEFNSTLVQAFDNRYNYYEICDNDEDVFYEMFKSVYDSIVLYYHEIISNYYKEYDYAVGNKRQMARHDVTHREGTGWDYTTDNNDRTDYDLPNKVVTPIDNSGYATGLTKDSGITDRKTGNEGDSTYDSTIIHTYDNEFLDLKKKYMQQIRNIIDEILNKFSDCFLHLFS